MYDRLDIMEHINDEFQDAMIQDLYTRYFNKNVPWTTGRNRCVFLFNTFVVKLPLNPCGMSDNDWEGSLISDSIIQLGRTRLIYHGEYPIVLMERISDASYDEITSKEGSIPDWVGFIDCGQVGYNKSGKLVAYDYGRT